VVDGKGPILGRQLGEMGPGEPHGYGEAIEWARKKKKKTSSAFLFLFACEPAGRERE